MRPVAVIIDSIQTVYLENVTGSAGSVSQVRDPPTPAERVQATDFLAHPRRFGVVSILD